ncbi:MAG: hypothetical protein O2923_13755 [Verrucomicrobia bacterium]|nr:hypothetical protein [Verrucomicrobiota bacterium]MDA1087239.1 hypothetical protein [Verrucomicrobiota bacterium]
MKKCEKCGTPQYEWETALSGTASCSNCGEPVSAPGPVRTAPRKLSVARTAPAGAPSGEGSATALESDSVLATELRHMIDTNLAVSSGIAITPTLISWVIMLLIGIPLGWLRYGGMMSGEFQSMFQYWGSAYGPPLLFGIHLVITLLATKDDFSKGMLCLLVPLYSFYYLMTLPDNHIFRMLVFLIFVLIGVDAYHSTVQMLAQRSDQISAWISGNEYEAGFE